MKVIISHDVDHLFWNDHLLDTWWPGLWLKTTGEVIKSNLKLSIARKRLFPGKNLHNIPVLCDFLTENNIPSTFFFGMRKGLNLSYSYKRAGSLIRELKQRDFNICLHGMAFNDRSLMVEEKSRFINLTGFEPLGIRNHYLRTNNSTYDHMSALGYIFDSSENKIDFPRKHKNLWSIPISVMDVNVIRGLNESGLNESINETLMRIKKAEDISVPYFVVNFHDYYFSDRYPIFVAYFNWIIEFFKKNDYDFISFNQAVSELNS